ncbi:MAG: hypothetical protein DIJKHBIC_02717 [Thermoanaerobaculia bacterium]|nr:hypothetical protein [Thermoanaerobaculia bacterium]
MARALLSSGLVPPDALSQALLGHPATVASAVTPEEADRIRERLRGAGASCKVVPSDPRRPFRKLPERARARKAEGQPRRRFPLSVAVLLLFCLFVAALVFFGRGRFTRRAPAAAPVAEPKTSPGIVTIAPGETREIEVRADLPLVVSDSSPVSARTQFVVRQNDWQQAGVTVQLGTQQLETQVIPVWRVRGENGKTWPYGLTAIGVPLNLPRGFDPGVFKDIGVSRNLRDLETSGALTETEFLAHLEKTGRPVRGVEPGRVRIHRMRIGVSISLPLSPSFSGEEAGTGLVSIGTQKLHLDTGAAGLAIPVDCGVQLRLTRTRGLPGLKLLIPPGASREPVTR